MLILHPEVKGGTFFINIYRNSIYIAYLRCLECYFSLGLWVVRTLYLLLTALYYARVIPSKLQLNLALRMSNHQVDFFLLYCRFLCRVSID